MSNAQSPHLIDEFKSLYHRLDKYTVNESLLSRCYHSDIEFQDPFHTVSGLPALNHYFMSLYQNVKRIEFEFHQHWLNEQGFVLSWTMQFQHPRINAGHQVSVEGISQLTIQDGVIIGHRDFFDGGQLLYEHIPLLGKVIRALKKRMSQ